MPSNYFEIDFSFFSTIVTEEGFLESAYKCPHIVWDTHVGVADHVEIPEVLLRGPWTTEMTIFLYWLVKNGARLEWVTSTSGEVCPNFCLTSLSMLTTIQVALLGFRKAISGGDLRVIYLLQRAGLDLDVEDLIWALTNAGGDRLAVLRLLIRMKIFSDVEHTKFRAAMEEFRDEAGIRSDVASIAFVNALEGLTLME
jgi:hypothetical protein